MNQDPIPRLTRLSSILTILQSHRLVTSTMLSKRFGVSVRTIYRDIKALEASGIPIYVEEGKGYSLVEGYQLPPIMFSEEEANALITGHRIIIQNKDQSLIDQYTNAITKIKAVLRSDNKDKANKLEKRVIYIKNLKKNTSSNNLMKIQSSLTNQNVVHLSYIAQSEKVTKRDIEPMAIYNTQENWIVIAWCRLREEYREFRLDRILELRVSSSKFNERKFDLMEYFRRGM